MAPRQRGSNTDPSTIGGGGQNIREMLSNVGGGDLPRLGDPKKLADEIEQLTFSPTNNTIPDDLEPIWDEMAGENTEADPKIITNDQELQAVEVDPSGYYKLGANIDMSAATEWTSTDRDDGFVPLGTSGSFTASIDGDGYVIKDLTVDTTQDNGGLIESVESSTTKDIIIENFIAYNFDVTTGRRAGAIAGTTSQNEETSEERRIFRDLIVLESEIEGMFSGGIVYYSDIGTTMERVGVAGCKITGTDEGTEVGGLTGFIDGYFWDDNSNSFSFNIYRDIYSYKNTLEGADTGNIGAFSGVVSFNGGLDTNAEFETVISNVVIAENRQAESAIAERREDFENGDPLLLEEFYHNDDIVGAAGDYEWGSAQATFTPLPTRQMRGDGIADISDGFDFEDVWSVVEEDVDNAIFNDGFPILSSLDLRLQKLGQGLGSYTESGAVGITRDGQFIGAFADAGETDPLRRSFGENVRLSSSSTGRGGIQTAIQSSPHNTKGARVIPDPNDPNKYILVGGFDDTEASVPAETFVSVYDTELNTWDDTVYSDLTIPTGPLRNFALGVGHDGGQDEKIIIAGGEVADPDDPSNITLNDNFYFYDIDGDGSWEEDEFNTLPEPVAEPAFGILESDLWVFGGRTGPDTFTDAVHKVSVSSGFFTSDEEGTLPTGPLENGGQSPSVNGELYINGNIADGVSGSFYKFNYDNETTGYEELSSVTGLEQTSGTEPAEINGGAMVHFNGNILYADGPTGFDQVDQTMYSIRDDEWVGIEPEVDLTSAPYSDYLGIKQGVVKDGVMYVPGTGSAQQTQFAYTIPRFPFY